MENVANKGSKPHGLGQWTSLLPLLLVVMLVLSGCSLLFGGGPERSADEGEEDRAVVPTFTPTPEVPATPTPEPVAEEAPTVAVEVATDNADTAPEAPAQAEAVTETGTVTEEAEVTNGEAVTGTGTETGTEAPPAAEAPAAPPTAKLSVNVAEANARNGPGTEYGLAGTLTQGQTFDIVGRNADGTWWQFCCVNGQQAWIFGQLVATENAEAVAVAQDIPAPPPPVAAAPPAQAPPPQAPPPEQPAPEQPAPEQPPEEPSAEEPPAEEQPQQAVHAGGCGGDDGCKFHIRTGPVKMQNSGGELKIQAAFIHSGVDGGQMQGDYRIGIEKDGQLIETFANVTSIALNSNDGPAGKYNYEAKINASDLPGGSLAGTYFFWVLDGNRERDSDVFRLDLGGNEGEVYIEFDQG